MDTSQQFSLRWNNYLSHITDAFDSLRTGEDLVDVTLSCEGKKIRAHKMLLSACSSYFRELFKENPCQHPVIIFRNVKHEDLVAIIDFMYQGEVNVEQEQLSSFLATAELLSIKGLTDGSGSEKIKKDIEETALPSAPVEIDDDPEPIIAKPVVSSSQNFLPISKRPSSPHKRKRKYSTHSVPINASNFSDKKHCVLPSSSSIQDDSADDEPIEIIPVIPCMKVEKQEYVEDSYEDITDDTQTMVNPLRTCDPSVKSSASEYNSINSSSSHHDITSGEISDMEQVLMEPGTSNENLTQDSVQDAGSQNISELNYEQTVATETVDSSSEITEMENVQEEESYACDVCRNEKKQTKDLSSHKCPICSEDLFCSHLLKEHMKVVHGWFMVQRRFVPH